MFNIKIHYNIKSMTFFNFIKCLCLSIFFPSFLAKHNRFRTHHLLLHIKKDRSSSCLKTSSLFFITIKYHESIKKFHLKWNQYVRNETAYNGHTGNKNQAFLTISEVNTRQSSNQSTAHMSSCI